MLENPLGKKNAGQGGYFSIPSVWLWGGHGKMFVTHAHLRQLEKIKVSVTQHCRQNHCHPDTEIKDGDTHVAGSIGTH